MIKQDQPTIFGDKLVVAVSSIEDGAMNFNGFDQAVISDNREVFLGELGIDLMDASLVYVDYQTSDFTRYSVIDDEHAGAGMVTPGSGVVADALVAIRPEQALFLPIADCIPAVIYDPASGVCMLSHLGRHSLEQEGGRKSIEYLVYEFDSAPHELLVWLGPAAGKKNYPIHALGGRGLHEVALQQMVSAGVMVNNIEISPVDTTENQDYYSHSEFLKGNQSDDGRCAVVVAIVE